VATTLRPLALSPQRPQADAEPLTLRGTAGDDSTLVVLDEMLDLLKSVTRAGERHMMGKIVRVLCGHPRASAGGPFIAHRLEDLRREAGKAAPDGDVFGRIARAVLATISTARAAR
jgi:hypothetical protein